MSKRDYYEILGVERQANEQEMKSAYRRLAMQYHPDRNPGNAEAEEKFKELNEAYGILSNSETRERYNRFGHAGVGTSAGAGGGNPWGNQGFGGFEDILGDLFGDFFTGGRGGRRNAAQRGEDVRCDLEISLEESAAGSTREIEIPRLDDCESCNGSGAAAGSTPTTCSTCRGEGQVRFQQGFFQVSRTCPQCRGAGKTIGNPCRTCRGGGRVERKKKIEVKIPAGVDSGQGIRLSGEGQPGSSGGPRGDLYVIFQVKEHEIFERQGEHLYVNLPLTFAQAALGGEVVVRTLDGEERLTIPEGTQNGKSFRLRGRGLPSPEGRSRGDLFAVASVVTPTRLTREQRRLLEELAALDDGQPATPKGIASKVRNIFG